MSNGFKFILCVGVVCLIYPPMLGYFYGMGLFFACAYILYILMGGNKGFFG
jgi:hypothetical protein